MGRHVVLPSSGSSGPGDWKEQAACAGKGGKEGRVFFPEPTGARRIACNASLYAEARAICSACPVRTDCLRYALRNNEREGMWGGLTPAERDVLAAELVAA